MITTLDTRLNAIRALESRISLIKSYLSKLSEDAKQLELKGQESSSASDTVSHPTLRRINALISHLSLLTPHDQAAFSTEAMAQSNDVAIISVLGRLGESVKAMRELGRKSAIVQASRQGAAGRKTQMGMSYGGRQRGYGEEFLRGV